jgi:hypothetical protein
LPCFIAFQQEKMIEHFLQKKDFINYDKKKRRETQLKS